MQVPLVSVILPTRDRADVLPRAVRSVLDQTMDRLELIVVDDASADDTTAVVQAIDDARLIYLRHGSAEGAAAARNRGLAVARGALVAFQDSDDEWYPDKLAMQVGALEVHADAEVCVCSYEHHKRGRVTHVIHAHRIDRGERVRRRLLHGESFATPTLLVRREALERIGGFDPELPRRQDYDLCLRLAEESTFVFLEQVLVAFHHREDSISADPAKYVEALDRLLDKHAALFDGDRAATSLQLFRAGRHCIEEGRIRASLPLFVRALAADPLNWKAAVCIAGVVSGAFALARAVRS